MEQTTRGSSFALLAFIWWGLSPIYFKAVSDVLPVEILAHRVVWSFLLVSLILFFTHKLDGVRRILSSKKQIGFMLLSSLLISGNWLTFIWAVGNDRVIEASLGYYINPLVSIFLGMLFLGERLNKVQWLALTLAATGVLIQLVVVGYLPWVALVLAFSFGFYGLVRKIAPADAFTGLWFETALALPLALMGLAWLGGGEIVSGSAIDVGLLAISGVVTTLPLIWFAIAARLLPLSFLGFFQYIAPTVSLLLAIFLFGESLTASIMLTFAFIWTALGLLVAQAVRRYSKTRRNA
ncbi:EamA family transporter RarD [Pelagibaculum spongiae]|uniref:EamA family transporter RarD n=1 Tax=Pelagibaculum spongiae TaxID=2080658 RepID=A0A2V1H4U3_9GAMM|nr:EamA family transporter RarD [Pelagibaculum spongiae]PVZ71795.1 EamA family transporter RarD [Pelagibaculum spongiae]